MIINDEALAAANAPHPSEAEVLGRCATIFGRCGAPIEIARRRAASRGNLVDATRPDGSTAEGRLVPSCVPPRWTGFIRDFTRSPADVWRHCLHLQTAVDLGKPGIRTPRSLGRSSPKNSNVSPMARRVVVVLGDTSGCPRPVAQPSARPFRSGRSIAQSARQARQFFFLLAQRASRLECTRKSCHEDGLIRAGITAHRYGDWSKARPYALTRL